MHAWMHAHKLPGEKKKRKNVNEQQHASASTDEINWLPPPHCTPHPCLLVEALYYTAWVFRCDMSSSR
jgi:hypothetical protein